MDFEREILLNTFFKYFTTIASRLPFHLTVSAENHQEQRSKVFQLELETKVHPKVHNHGEGPYEDLLLVESGYYTFNILRHYAKQALTPRSLKVKLGPRRNYHKGRAAIRHYANQTARPL